MDRALERGLDVVQRRLPRLRLGEERIKSADQGGAVALGEPVDAVMRRQSLRSFTVGRTAGSLRSTPRSSSVDTRRVRVSADRERADRRIVNGRIGAS